MLSADRQKRKGILARKCLLWLLALTFFWCSAGTVLWNGAQTICYHYSRLQRHHASDTLILSEADVIWVKKNEIRYQGRMFDVKTQTKQTDGRILLAGHYDDVESILFTLLDNIIDNEHPENSNSTVIWSFCAILSSTSQMERPLFKDPVLILHKYKTIVYSPYETSPPTPPPDVAA